MTIQCMEAGLFISQVKYSTQRRILFGLGLLVQELDWIENPRKYPMLWLSYSNHSKFKMCQKGSLDTHHEYFFIPIISSPTPLLLF